MKLRLGLSFFLGLALTFSTPMALAQSPKKEISYSDKEKAKELVKEGTRFFEAEDFEKALSAFQGAYSLNPETKYLPPLGQCYSRLGRYEEALEAYSTFLRDAEPDHPLRPEVERRSLELKELIAKKNPGGAPATKPSAQSAPAVKPVAAISKPQESPRVEVPKKSPNPFPKYVFIGGALSGALGATVGAVTLFSTRQLNDLTNPASFPELDKEAIADQQARRERLAPLSNVLFGVAIGAGGTALIWRQTSKKKERLANTEISLAPTGVALSIRY